MNKYIVMQKEIADMSARQNISLLMFMAVFCIASESPALEPHSFDTDWQFTTNISAPAASAGWQAITLPHAARLEPLFMGDKMWMGECLYRKVFTANHEWKDRRVCLNIEAAMHTADVSLNGKPITSHAGGYLPFQIELSGWLNYGATNELLIKLDNRENSDVPPGRLYHDLDFSWYHGLYRNVDLLVTDKLHITDPVAANLTASGGIFVTYPKVSADEATVQVRVHVKNDRAAPAKFSVRCLLSRITAKTEQACLAPGESGVYTLTLTVPSPKLWSPADPNLYKLNTEILDADSATADSKSINVGIRSVTCKAGAFAINGRKMYLRGTNRHQEYPYIGYALPDSAQWRDAAMIKQAGFDFVRLSHYPNSPAFIDACDYYGIIVMEPIPGWQFYKDGIFTNRCLQNARDMIRRDRNHPSCIFWETSLNETGMPGDFLKQLHEIAGQECPGTFSASHNNSFHDVFIPARQHTGGPKYWDDWKQGDKPIFTAEYGDWEYYANQAANFNQTGAKDLKWEESNSRQRRADGEKRMLQQALNFQEGHNQNHVCASMIGDANWLFSDYNRGCAPDHCTSGIVDIFRLPKFVYYFFESQRAPKGEVRAHPMVFIASYWTEKSPLSVRVYSNCDEVELCLNGARIARQKPSQDIFSKHLAHPPFTFAVPSFAAGELKAIAYISGKRVAEHVVRTPGKPAKIRLVTMLSDIPVARKAKDAFFVHAKILDSNGTLVPDASIPVKFAATNAELASPEQITSQAGISSALVLSSGNGRRIHVSAKAEGMDEASLTIK